MADQGLITADLHIHHKILNNSALINTNFELLIILLIMLASISSIILNFRGYLKLGYLFIKIS